MRRVVLKMLSILSFCVAGPNLHAQSLARPLPDDTTGWIAYCTGFYRELQRQATPLNNQLQFNQAERRATNLGYEFIVVDSKGAHANVNDLLAWKEKGAQDAGEKIWDAAPLFNPETSANTEALRLSIQSMRAPIGKYCDDFADKAGLYQGEATGILTGSARTH